MTREAKRGFQDRNDPRGPLQRWVVSGSVPTSPSSPVPTTFPCRPAWHGAQGPIWACPPC